MKKLLLALIALFTMFYSLSADTFQDGEKITEDFFNRGQFVKVIKNKNNTYYFSKPTISGIRIDEDDMEISTIGFNIWTGKNDKGLKYEIDDYDIKNDENGNIIISRK